MTTQRTYRHSLVGFLALALLVVLGAGGCGNSSSTKGQAFEADNQVYGLVDAEGTTYVEDDAEMICDEPTADECEIDTPLGYREPGYSDTMETGTVTDEMDSESSESTSCYEDEDVSTEVSEEYGMVEEDDSSCHEEAWTPALTDGDDASSQNNDMEDSSLTPTADQEETEDPVVSEESSDETGETAAVSDEEDMSVSTEEGDSDTSTPWIGGEDETVPDSNPDDTMSDLPDTSDDGPVSD